LNAVALGGKGEVRTPSMVSTNEALTTVLPDTISIPG
jgi:hypothetical protein